MKRIHNKLSGFSLTEMLIATGIMAVGLVMIATVFPVGVKLTSLTTERTIGAVAADEAFAKIKLYGQRDFEYWPSAQIAIAGGATIPQAEATTETTCTDYQYVTAFVGPDGLPGTVDDNSIHPGLDGVWGNSDDVFWDSEFLYPSTDISAGQDRNYHWSALCRRVGLKDVQVTVFVNRKIAAGAQYFGWEYTIGAGYSANPNSPWPKPVPVNVDYFSAQPKELMVKDNPAFPATESKYFFDDGYTVVDDLTGKIYRVLEVDHTSGILTLQEDWQWVGYPLAPVNEVDRTIWVVPPAVGSDRYPCVGVYQKVMRFDDIQ